MSRRYHFFPYAARRALERRARVHRNRGLRKTRPDSTALRHALVAHGHELPILPATPPLRSALATVGLRTTPYLLVLDGDGALRFATGAPESVSQYLALGRTLPLVADPMPTSSSADSRVAAGTPQ